MTYKAEWRFPCQIDLESRLCGLDRCHSVVTYQPMTKNDLIRLRLPQALKESFTAHCGALGVTPSEAIRRLIERALDGQVSLREKPSPASL